MCGSVAMGKTHNSNETLHSVMWHNSPKGKYVRQKCIQPSTALDISSFNEGSIVFAALFREYNITSSHSTLNHLAERDRSRILKKRAILQTNKRRRRQLSVRPSAVESSRKRRAGSKYHSGSLAQSAMSQLYSNCREKTAAKSPQLYVPFVMRITAQSVENGSSTSGWAVTYASDAWQREASESKRFQPSEISLFSVSIVTTHKLFSKHLLHFSIVL